MNIFLAKLITFILLTSSSLPGHAHELWLEPENFIIQPNSKLNAHIKVGQKFNGDKFPYLHSETKSLKLFLKKKTIILKLRDGDYPAIQSSLKKAGLYTLSYESIPERVNYKNFETFQSFLKEQDIWDEWSEKNSSLINTDINETYTRYAKSLINVGDGLGEDFNTGLLFELIALNNPYVSENKVEILLLYKNKPFANSQITIFNKINDQTIISKTRTDNNGKAFIPLNKGGIFLLSAVHFKKSEIKNADWHSLWASLTFEK